MYCAESVATLWFSKLVSGLSESVASAVITSGVAESAISYVASGSVDHVGVLLTSVVLYQPEPSEI